MGIPFIETNPIDFSLPQDFNWLFFTSPKGVTHFFDWVDYSLILKKNIGCIGQGTKKALEGLQIKVDFEGKDEVERVAFRFSNHLAKEDRVLFPVALESRLTIQNKLSDSQVINLPVYQSNLRVEKLSFDPDVIVFTSPSNVKGYFNSGNTIGENTVIISIGETTANELKLNNFNSETPTFPSEEELVKLTLSVL